MKPEKRTSSKKTTHRGRTALAVLVIVLVGAGAAAYFFGVPALTQAQQGTAAEPQTYTAPVTRGELRITAAGSGKLVASRSVDLSFPTTGTLSELNVSLGDTVKEGQVLASLGSSATLQAGLASAKLAVLEAQKAIDDLHENAGLSLAQAYSDLVSAQARYDAALQDSQRLAYARCGQDAAIRLAESLERAGAALANVRAETSGSDAYIAAKQAYDTALANYNQCSTTQDEKDTIQSALDVAAAGVQETQDNYNNLKAASGSVDPAKLALYEANLKLAKARLIQAEDELAGSTLAAPMDGKVTYLAASEGDLVGTGKFITIVDTNRAALEISVNEADLERLVVGSPVEVTFDALPGASFSGTLVQVYPQITNSGQYRIAKGLAELDEAAVKTVSALPLGLSATVTVVNQEAKDALLIPVIALKDLGGGSYAVMVQGRDGTLALRPVTVGLMDNDYAQVTSGLEEGEQVSTGTTDFIAAGSSTSADSLKNSQNEPAFPGGGKIFEAP